MLAYYSQVSKNALKPNKGIKRSVKGLTHMLGSVIRVHPVSHLRKRSLLTKRIVFHRMNEVGSSTEMGSQCRNKN